VHYVEDSARAAELAASIVESGDLVLVKGSRGVRTEIVVERLTAGRG
jgi:UDP-N-acetylmuramyl pentapeptide synthase